MCPKVSIILFPDDNKEHIKRAIDNILEQTFFDFELLIVEQSLKEKNRIMVQDDDPRIKRIPLDIESNIQPIIKAIQSAQGDYVTFYHIMDIWAHDKLEKQVQHIEGHTGVTASFTLIEYMDDSGQPIDRGWVSSLNDKQTKHQWLRHFFFKGYKPNTFSMLILTKHMQELYIKYGVNALNDCRLWVTLFLAYDTHILQEKLVFRQDDCIQKDEKGHVLSGLDCIYILECYRNINSKEDWLSVFPEISEYIINDEFNKDYAFAKICLKLLNNPSCIYFGLQLLAKVLDDPVQKRQVENLYDFNEEEMEKITRQYMPFSILEKPGLYTATLYIKEEGKNVFVSQESVKYTIGFDGQYMVQFFIEDDRNTENVEYIFSPFKNVWASHKIFSCRLDGKELILKPASEDDGKDLFNFLGIAYKLDLRCEKDTAELKNNSLKKRTLTIHGEIIPIKYKESPQVLASKIEVYSSLCKFYIQKYNSLYKSRSWRITAPLRGVFNLFRRSYDLGLEKISLVIKGLNVLKSKGFSVFITKVTLYIHNSNAFMFIRKKLKVPEVSYEAQQVLDLSQTKVKLIAYYLPQFHTFVENDTWWGKGFTEWTNVKRSKPFFPGHIQPEEPHESVGYYNLLNPEVMHKQIKLAKQHGIYGFCFHHYWFSGKRLMEKPVDMFLEHPELDMPFCLNWANENWTRRWDGQDQEVLIAQKHCVKDDIAFMNDIIRYFRDPRYIRVEGRPVFLVYHAKLLPDMASTLERWRNFCRNLGEAEPFFVMVQSFDNYDPALYGFDAAAQFPPHNPKSKNFPRKKNVKGLSRKFKGNIYSYDDFMEEGILGHTQEFPLFPGVCTYWDNTPRRMENAQILFGATPKKFAYWLKKACDFVYTTHYDDRAFVFINSWNEWAEGAHLEPSKALGYAYLNATSEALSAHIKEHPFFLDESLKNIFDKKNSIKVLFIGHNAYLAGAQVLLLDQLWWLKKHTIVESFLLLMEDSGALKQKFKACVPTKVLEEDQLDFVDLESFCDGIPDIIFGNTSLAADLYEKLSLWGVPIITYVHELESSLQQYVSSKMLENLKKYSSHIICASETIYENLVRTYGINKDICSVVRAFINPKMQELSNKEKILLRKELGLPISGKIILACGTQSFRKGIDLFIDMVDEVLAYFHDDPPVFCWVGFQDTVSFSQDIMEKIKKHSQHLFFPGEVLDSERYFQVADIFVLPSREDPFPLVCLEAAACSLPVVCFEDAGDIPSLVGVDGGIVVPYGDISALSQACVKLLKDKALRVQLGAKLKEKLLAKHITNIALPHILNIIRRLANKPHPVSIIVPNYNYFKYLDARLESIIQQTFRDVEVILLDDVSTDNSLFYLEKWSKKIDAKLIVNTSNTGSAIQQWKKGLEHAQGQFIWIAEADDLCAENFLSELLKSFKDEAVVLSYTLPQIIDEDGIIQKTDYRNNYLSFASKSRWDESYSTEGKEEICSALAIVNTIPNVSAVLFRMPNNLDAIDASLTFRYSGDWMFYLNFVASGKVVYVRNVKAWHRRHVQSIVAGDQANGNTFLAEEARQIHKFVQEKYALSEATYIKMESFIESL